MLVIIALLSTVVTLQAMAKNNDNLVIKCNGKEEAGALVDVVYGLKQEDPGRLIVEEIIINKNKIELTYKFTKTFQTEALAEKSKQLEESLIRIYQKPIISKIGASIYGAQVNFFNVNANDVTNAESSSNIKLQEYQKEQRLNYSMIQHKSSVSMDLSLDGVLIRGEVICKTYANTKNWGK